MPECAAWGIHLLHLQRLARIDTVRLLLQVVVRNGKAIVAIPPDYKLLDYDPDKRMYLYANMQLTNDSFVENQGGMGKARASFAGSEDCAELRSYPAEAQLRKSVDSEQSLVRGLSVVLPSEGVSSPPACFNRTTSSVRFPHSHKHASCAVLVLWWYSQLG